MVRCMFGVAFLASLLAVTGSLSCGASSDEASTSEASQAVTDEEECDLRPIDRKGSLRACAAGKTTVEGPGKPEGFVEPPPPSAEEIAADVAAASRDQEKLQSRDGVGQDPRDLGFPSRPVEVQEAVVTPSQGEEAP